VNKTNIVYISCLHLANHGNKNLELKEFYINWI